VGVTAIAKNLLDRLLEQEVQVNPRLEFTHFFVVTSCPETLSPSLGQTLQAAFPKVLSRVPTHDFVQGCAGSVTNLSLAAELAQLKSGRILFLAVEAASEAVSERSELYPGFSDGGFACVIDATQGGAMRLLKSATIQYPEVRDTVLVELGHRSRQKIHDQLARNDFDLHAALRQVEDALGLKFDRRKALKLASHAGGFATEFFADQEEPEFLILHQVNPRILEDVRAKVFARYPGFIDESAEVGNCGVASVGVVLSKNWTQVQGKRVFLCSFGTGGVISGSYWQF